MANNVAKIYLDSDDNFSGFAAAAIIGQRFVNIAPSVTNPNGNGNKPSFVLASAGGEYSGVSGLDQNTVGGDIDVYTEGVIGVLCSGGLTAGQKVSAGAGGVAVAFTTGPTHGQCTANTADGAIAPIMLQGL